MKILAIISARGGSKRLPGKNVQVFLGRPLIAWTIEFVRGVSWFNDVVVSTDSQDVANAALAEGVKLDRLRPEHLATDLASSVDVVIDELMWRKEHGSEYHAVALLQPTTPVRFLHRWEKALDLVRHGKADSVIGVKSLGVNPRIFKTSQPSGWLVPYSNNTVSQGVFPEGYVPNGSLYLISVSALVSQKTFFPVKSLPVLCDHEVENIDIDTYSDWLLAEQLVKQWQDTT